MLKHVALGIAVLGVLLFGVVWYALGALDFSNMYVLESHFGHGPTEQATYERLYQQTLVIARYAAGAQRFAYAIPASFLVVAALLFGWARDRKQLRSLMRSEATPTHLTNR